MKSTNGSEFVNADEIKFREKEVERKILDDQLHFQQLNEIKKIKFIIAFITQVIFAAQFLQKISEEAIRRLHQSEREFAADMQQFQADIKRMELAVQIANELAAAQKKIAELKAQLEQLKAYLEIAILMLTNFINTVNKRYTANANALIDSTKSFVNSLNIQQFHNRENVYDLKEHLQIRLEVVYNKLHQRQIEPKDFKNEVMNVVRSCVATFMNTMNITDYKKRQSVRATVVALVDQNTPKLEGILDSQANLLNSLQADHVVIKKADQNKNSLINGVAAIENTIDDLNNASQVSKTCVGDQVNYKQVEATFVSLSDATKNVNVFSKDSTETLDDLESLLQPTLETPKLTSPISSPTLDNTDDNSELQHRHAPGCR